MRATARVTLVRVEDREGAGTCLVCGREGLRWVCVLSDGSQVGTECAKPVLGWKPTPQQYKWTPDYRPVAEHDDGELPSGGRCIYVLWQHKTGSTTRETRNGRLTAVGGARDDWQRRGWL